MPWNCIFWLNLCSLLPHLVHCLLHVRLDPSCSWQTFWNFLHRQMYVLDTYITRKNKRINHALAAAHFIVSCALALPIPTGEAVESSQNVVEQMAVAHGSQEIKLPFFHVVYFDGQQSMLEPLSFNRQSPSL